MTDKQPPRFMVRQCPKDYMVYDRELRGPAKLSGEIPAVGLSQEEAVRLKDALTEHPPVFRKVRPEAL